MGGSSYNRSDYSSGSGRSSSDWGGSSGSSSSSSSSRSSSSSSRTSSSTGRSSSGAVRNIDGEIKRSSLDPTLLKADPGSEPAAETTPPKPTIVIPSIFDYSPEAAKVFAGKPLNTALFPRKRELVCEAETGVVIVLDHTMSVMESIKTFWDKAPMVYGQIEQQGYLKDFAISVAIVGDINSDIGPLQICDFKKGLEIDQQLAELAPEGKGGPGKNESYEVMALYYLRHAQFTHPNAQKPFIFFIGDEGFYERINGAAVEKHFGDNTRERELASREIFRQLQEKYNAFFIHIPYFAERWPDASSDTVQSRDPESDKAICERWKEIFGQNFITLDEPKGFVDVILGCIALQGQSRTLEEYLEDMQKRQQTTARIERVGKALQPKSDALAKLPDEDLLTLLPKAPPKEGNSARI